MKASKPGFQIRVSTVLLAIAALSLPVAALFRSLQNSFQRPYFEATFVFIDYLIFPVCSVIGIVAALVFLISQRTWQFAIEAALGIGLILFFLSFKAFV